MDELTREKLKEILNAPPLPPLEATRNFLQSYCSDEDSIDSIRRNVARMILINPRTILAGLAGIEELLINPPAEEGALAYLVAYEAGWVLDDPSDVGAAAWLRELAQILRQELKDKNMLPDQ